jgi:hypothetical protein
LSDLANSCENLNIEKMCTAIIDNSKAQASRQLKCVNDEKNTCCYLCTFKPKCVISCKYLGQTENYTYSALKIETPVIPQTTESEEESKTENLPVSFCFSCNSEMAWTKTNFTIEDWNGPKPVQANDKILPVTIYLCPKCGKIEFKVDQHLSEAQ